MTILAGVAEFEREIIRERTLSGVRAARARGKVLGRPRRVFRRDELIRLRDIEGLSWRAIATQLGVPVPLSAMPTTPVRKSSSARCRPQPRKQTRGRRRA